VLIVFFTKLVASARVKLDFQLPAINRRLRENKLLSKEVDLSIKDLFKIYYGIEATYNHLIWEDVV
jgi:hypothetical protein